MQGGLEQCGKGRDMEKENVDPAPKVKHPRLPRAKKVCTIVDVLSLCFGEDRTRLPSYHAPYAVIFFVVCALCCSLAGAGGYISTDPQPPTGCGRGRRIGTMHTDSHHASEGGLEAPHEARPNECVRRCGGDYAAKEVQVNEGAYAGLPSIGCDATDAHAGERGGKRLQTAASRHDAISPT